jgi:yersiniabactin nonribosomal peptide synthetase
MEEALPILQRLAAELLDVTPESLDPDADLYAAGLDSLRLFRLSNAFLKEGFQASLAEMHKNFTLKAWAAIAGPVQVRPAQTRSGPAAILPLKPMQAAYLAGRQGKGPYASGAHHYFEFDGSADPDLLEHAVAAIIARHAALRLSITPDGRQQIADTAIVEIVRHDLRRLTAVERDIRLAVLRQKGSSQPLDVANGQTFAVDLALLSGKRTRTMLKVDMIACDAASFRILAADLVAAMSRQKERPPLAPYRSETPHSPPKADPGCAARWLARLEDVVLAPTLPGERAAKDAAQPMIRRTGFLTAPERDQLDALCRSRGLTLTALCTAVYCDAIAEHSADEDFAVIVPFNRYGAENGLVGNFTQTLPLVWRGSIGPELGSAARSIKDALLSSMDDGNYTTTQLWRDLSAHGRPAGPRAVLTSMIGLGDLIPETVTAALGSVVWVASETPDVGIDLQLYEDSGGVRIIFEAREAFVRGSILDRIACQFEARLRAVLTDPASLDRPTERQRRVLRGPARALSDERLEDALLRCGRGAKAGAPALLGQDGATKARYGDLLDLALRVSGGLIRQGVVPGDHVALALSDTQNEVAAVCGCFLAGAAYVPIRADAPRAMVADVAHLANPRLCIVDEGSAAAFAGLNGSGIELWQFENLLDEPQRAAGHGGSDARAYVLFTSGSTGSPKAVAVSHRAALATIDSLCAVPGLLASDGLLGLSDLTFDLSVYDIFATLRSGARLMRMPRAARTEPARWAEAVSAGALTVWQSAPQFLDLALWKPDQRLRTLRHVLLGGDVVAPKLLERLRKSAPDCRLWALGGATETAIHSTIHQITDPEAPAPAPYGIPLANVSLRVVDRVGRDRPSDVPGELWIGGPSCAEGYLGDPDRTAARFVEREGERWYRTGDRAWIDAHGCVHFNGRLDRRIKIAGQIADLGAIESALMGIEGIHGAVAVYSEQGGLRIALETELPERALDRAIANRLPIVHRPARLSRLDRFPMTPNGKIDRAAIARMVGQEDFSNRPAPADATLAIVLDTAGAVLGRPVADGAAHFYTLGGNSLQAIDLVRRLDAQGITVDGALELIATAPLNTWASAAQCVVAPKEAFVHDGRLTPVQEAYRFGRGDSFDYGQLAPLWYWEFRADHADASRLSKTLEELVARHPSLRERIGADGLRAAITPAPRVSLVIREDENSSQLDSFRREVMATLEGKGDTPHVGAGILRQTEGDRIGLVFDIMFVDARSIAIAMEEIGAHYSGRPCRAPKAAASLVTSRTDATQARRRWAKRLDRLPVQPSLPLRPPARPSFARRSLHLDASAWDRLRTLAAEAAITPTALIATIYADTLLRWTGDEALALNVTLFDTPLAREDQLGEYTRLVPLFVEAGSVTLASLGAAVGREMAAAVDGAAYGSIDLARDMSQAHGSGQALLPFVLTSTIGLDIGRVLNDSGLGRYVGGLSQTPQTWIDCQLMEAESGLHVNWDVLETAFPKGLADAMFGGFETLLKRIATGPANWRQASGRFLPGITLSAAPQTALPGKGLHGPFFARAAASPSAIALLPQNARPVTYGVLAARALSIAARLRECGVTRGSRVGLLLGSRADLIGAALAVHAAGAAYVPLNASWPQERMRSVIQTARISVILGDGCIAGDIAGARCLYIDEPANMALDQPDGPQPDQTAYVIFTSGTTGAAKGVTVGHAAARNTVDAMRRSLELGSDDCLLAVSPFDFDLSVFDLFGVLGAGGRLALTESEGKPTPSAWATALERHRVTLWNSAPSLLAMTLDASSGGTAAPLRYVLLSGDRIAPDLPTRVSTWAPGAVMKALGGATEAGIWSNTWQGSTLPVGWSGVPYGRPLTGQKHRVVDNDGAAQPDWAPGELWIGGNSLADGYENDADRTEAAFVKSEGTRWYRTGDRARVRSDGLIEFLGRMDPTMGKVNGVRIDCEEVGAALAALPGISEALAQVSPGQPARLLGFVRCERGTHPDPNALRAHLAQSLPAALVPSQIVPMDHWPVTSNGKLNRAALTAMADCQSTTTAVPWRPTSDIERWVEALWLRLLNTNARTGRSFLQDGGDSLIALRITDAVERTFGITLPLRTVFFEANAEQLARELQTRCAERDSSMEVGEI